ncbi:MAG TPA: hypothetical protein VGN88_01510, partial [Phycisphaerae bacterium]
MEFQVVRPRGSGDEALVMRGLRVLVGGPEVAPGVPGGGDPAAIDERIAGFLAYAQTIKLDTRRQVLAMKESAEGAVVAGMCLWVPATGRTAMMFGPGLSDYPEAAGGTECAVVAALEDARAAGIVLVQAMMEPSDAAGKTVFAAAGLSQLATLTYMERKPPVHPPTFSLPPELTLAAYDAGTHEYFKAAIEGSYEKTLDCPALSEMRD